MTRTHSEIQSDPRRSLLVLLAGGLAGLLASAHAQAVTLYSLDPGSANVAGGAVAACDILSPPGPPPTVALPCAAGALGPLIIPLDDLDAMTYGSPAKSPLFFSVDRASVGVAGVPPDVFSENTVFQSEGDIFFSPPGPFPPGGGANALFLNQATLGEVPFIPPGVLAVGLTDELDALDLSQPAGPLGAPTFFSLSLGNTLLVSGADLLGPGGGIAVGFAALGLMAVDDIDALHFDPLTGTFFFSLTLGSPSLGAAACGGTSTADIFGSFAGGACFLAAPAASLGLLASDNVDAIALVPEPGTLLLFGAGLVGLALRGYRREPSG